MTIELTPELEALVRTRAEQNGLDAGALVANILRDALAAPVSSSPDPARRRGSIARRFQDVREQLTPQERRALDDLPADFAAEHDHYLYGAVKKGS